MTEFREGDLVQVRQICRAASYVGEVGLIVELEEPAHQEKGRYLVGVVWPHVATIRWYWTTDLVKVAG